MPQVWLLFLVSFVPGAQALLVGDEQRLSMEQGRATYLELRTAVKEGRWSDYEALRERLDAYPLAPYADYEALMVRLRQTEGRRARRFVEANDRSPLGVRYLGNYLSVAGRDRRWGDFLEAAPREPRSEKLRCYYARAKRGRGAEEEAWALTDRLFLSASSVDKACDPLFRLWRAEGRLTSDLIWERARLAFAAREGGLLRYLASLGGPEAALEALKRAYEQPHLSSRLAADLDEGYAADVLTLGLERYSRYAPGRALQQYQALDPDALSLDQRSRVENAIALRGLIERDVSVRTWVDANLEGLADPKLTALRLRWAIAEGDWPVIERTASLLVVDDPGEGAWSYWQARALVERGAAAAAEQLFEALAKKRSYYGFLSADRLGLPYAFQETRVPPLEAARLSELPSWLNEATWRVHELNAIDSPRLAHSEWNHALQRTDQEAKLLLARLAQAEGWHSLAIDAANAGRAWDALDLRFPLAYVDAFESRAARRELPTSELMAIARRESAFFPGARSPVGARGLMQLMPSTGIAVARKTGIELDVGELYDVDHNLDLGSAYYRQLLDRFDGNRAVALAAYNAGPNRVQHWVGKDLPVDAWIETIPYRETRAYVKAVLAYSVVFDHRLGAKLSCSPMRSEMRATEAEAPRLSVVLPVLNEGSGLAGLLRSLRRGFPEAEVIVVDGGSADDTVAVALRETTQVLVAPPGRAAQMNLGAAVARGECLLFLHADCEPRFTADAFAPFLASADTAEEGAWGFFSVALTGRSAILPLIAWFMNLRSRLTRVATGDQGIYVQRSLFERVGGFAAIPLMEDVELCKRLRRVTPPHLPGLVITASGRRWDEQGPVRTILRMWGLRLAYWLGVSPERLWSHYYAAGPSRDR